jgi:hypothetical protein
VLTSFPQFPVHSGRKPQNTAPAAEKATVAYSATESQFRPIEDQLALEAFRSELNLPTRFILSLTRVTHPGLDK